MKVFFAGSIRGGRRLIPVYKLIIRILKSTGCIVISEHVANEGLDRIEKDLTEEEIFKTDIQWIDECDVLIAEITTPSIGVGYEVCHALNKKKPVLCLFQKDAKASAMILGNTSRLMTVRPYENEKQLNEVIKNYFSLLLPSLTL